MKGLELARGYYETYGRPMLETQFPALAGRIAVGLCGEGSECFGYDDDFSTDHDFEPGFCLWMTSGDYAAHGFALERAYAKLPATFGGYSRSKLAPMGGARHGVWVIDDFYRRFLGAPTPPDHPDWWLYTPASSLACACNGQVFRDDMGLFSAVRQKLLAGYPEDVRKKKLAAHTLLMSQAGRYNYPRCIRRGETGAAQLCVFEFVRHAVAVIYLLSNVYQPFYKWVYRGMRSLPVLSELEPSLVALTELGNTPEEAAAKQASMQDISALFLAEYHRACLTDRLHTDPEHAAYAIIDSIRDATLRNRHILDGAE